MLKAVLAGARGVASADSAPPAASAMGVPPIAPLPRKAVKMAKAVTMRVRMGMARGMGPPAVGVLCVSGWVVGPSRVGVGLFACMFIVGLLGPRVGIGGGSD